MNTLILAIHYPVASGRYVFDALKRLGHDVRSAGPSTGRMLPWVEGGWEAPEQYVWQPSPSDPDWQPDLVIVMDSALQIDSRSPQYQCPNAVVYGVDNHVRDYHQFDPYVSHFFLAHSHGLRMGEPGVWWLPCGYDPAYFTPGKPWAEREHNAAMLAVQYPPRAELLAHLLDGTRHGIQYGLAIYDQYAAIYQNAKISLVVSAAHDVAQRVWETAAMGCLVLMDDCPDCEALGLVDGVNCLIYHSFEEAVVQYDWALAHPDDAAEIATKGQAWAQPGTWDARAQAIIEWAEQRLGRGAKLTPVSDYRVEDVVVTRDGQSITVTGFRGAGADARGLFELRNTESNDLAIQIEGNLAPVLVRPGVMIRVNNLGGGVITRLFEPDFDHEIDVEWAEAQRQPKKATKK